MLMQIISCPTCTKIYGYADLESLRMTEYRNSAFYKCKCGTIWNYCSNNMRFMRKVRKWMMK